MNKDWTAQEKQILRDFYPLHGAPIVGKLTRRPVTAIRKKAQELGVRRAGCAAGRKAGAEQREWAEIEEQQMRDHYRELGPSALAEKLARPLISVYAKAANMGLSTPKKRLCIGDTTSYATGKNRKIRVVRVAHTGVRWKDWKRVEVAEWERLHGPVPEGFVLVAAAGMERVAANCRLVSISEMPLLAAYASASAEERELIALKSKFHHRLSSIEKRDGAGQSRNGLSPCK